MFTGIITALVTPFRDNRVDEQVLRDLVEDQIANGVDGLIPAGTTGESATLTNEEHVRVIRIVVETARKRVPVIAGTGSNSTHEAIELTRAAHQVGADATLQVVPYYNKPTQEGMYRHFKAVAAAAPLPVVLYNVPSRTSCDLLPDTVARLTDTPNIVAIKEATGSAARASQILARTGDRMTVLSGDDATAFPLFVLGAKGCISVVSNVDPSRMSAMWDAAVAGDWNRARELHFQLFPLSEGLFVEANPIPVKAALSMMGRIADELRLPLLPLSDAHRGKLRDALAKLGLLKT